MKYNQFIYATSISGGIFCFPVDVLCSLYLLLYLPVLFFLFLEGKRKEKDNKEGIEREIDRFRQTETDGEETPTNRETDRQTETVT